VTQRVVTAYKLMEFFMSIKILFELITALELLLLLLLVLMLMLQITLNYKNDNNSKITTTTVIKVLTVLVRRDSVE